MFADRDRNSDLQGQVMIPFTYRLLDFQGMSTQNGDGRVSPHVKQRSPDFVSPWIRLTWCSSYKTHPNEYFKAVQEENRRRDKSGWRRISKLTLPLKSNPAIDRCKGGSRYIRRHQREKKRTRGRPAAGSAEAKSQTAAACEANRRRHAINRMKQELRVKQVPK